MLTLQARADERTSFGRRQFLRIGGLGLGGLTWADVLQQRETVTVTQMEIGKHEIERL